MNIRFSGESVRIRISQEDLLLLSQNGTLQCRYSLGRNASFTLSLKAVSEFDLCWAWPGLVVSVPEGKLESLKKGAAIGKKADCSVSGDFQGTQIVLELDYFQRLGLR